MRLSDLVQMKFGSANGLDAGVDKAAGHKRSYGRRYLFRCQRVDSPFGETGCGVGLRRATFESTSITHISLWRIMKTRSESTSAKPGGAVAASLKPKKKRAAPAPGRGRPLTVKRRALGPIGKLEDFIPYKLAVVANRVSQSIGDLFESKFNIQFTEWRILMALYAYSELNFAEVVDRTSMDKARVSRAQKRLVDLGMVTTKVDPEDGRRLYLSLTSTGAQRCHEILPAAAAREAWFLAALDDSEHHQLDVILNKLIARSNELLNEADATAR